MDIIESPVGQIIISSVIELVSRYYGDVNFEWASAVGQGILVGGCAFVGGILGGRLGVVTGGLVGSHIGNYLTSTIVTLRQMISRLDATQLRDMCILLWERVQRVSHDVLNVTNLNLTRILELYGRNNTIQSTVIEIISNFLSQVHGNHIHRL